MPEQIKKVIDKVVEWWKKFSTRQRIFMISITAVLILALIILYAVVSRPVMVELYKAEDAKEAAEIKELLDSDTSIDYEIGKDNLTFSVDQKDEATANMLLGANDYPSVSYDINNVVNGSMTTTQKDKEILYKDYLEKKFASDIEILENVESATVSLTIPDDDGTILSSKEESTAAVILTLCDDMSTEQAAGLAQFVATQLGNTSTDKVTIMDSKNNVLFVGSNADSTASIISSQLSYKEQVAAGMKNQVIEMFQNSKVYSTVNVALHLDMDFSQKEVVDKQYTVPEGQTNGPTDSESYYENSTTGGSGGVPGTDSNDDTTYVTEDDEYTTSDTIEYERKYLTDEKVTTSTDQGGNINYESSTVTVVTTKTTAYYEKTLRENGTLDNISYEEYKTQNGDKILVETNNETLVQSVATATGLPTDNITVLSYEQPVFFDEEEETRSWSDILQIALTVLIFALLGFVVFRSTRSQKEPEPEPELSVEALLESTVENVENLEDIGYSEKSETRLLIEKFVDENPDAVAILLRNWLNEEWE
ncbi:MAG: flagellar biosynthesis protein [Agathobacter sp.]|nr:flagellar biosynthesis protein [Agathobacter sp.]